jgi:non-heme chloroperoxidase
VSATSLPHLSLPAHDGFVTVAPGVTLAYMDRGQGQPIVFLTGWSFAKEMFEKQLAGLARSYRVITYDPRSQGGSSFTMDGNDYLTHAVDLDALLTQLKVTNPILVGWNAGAHTAWAYIRKHGAAAVAANVTVNTMPKCLSPEADAWVAGSLERVAGIHTIYLRDAAGHASFVRSYAETNFVQRELDEAEVEWVVAQSLKTRTLVAAQLFAAYMFSDQTSQAIAVAKARPTLIFIGQPWAEKAVPFIKRLLPESKYVVFGGSAMFWEHPDAFNQVLDEFIRQNVGVYLQG